MLLGILEDAARENIDLQRWNASIVSTTEKITGHRRTTIAPRITVKPELVTVRDNRLNGIVNLHTKECTCKEFDSLDISCSHAIVAAKERNILIHSLCSRFYTVDSLMTAYAEPINPLGHISEWKKPSGYVEKIIFPLKFVPQVGRRRVRRIPSIGEFRRQMKCGRCGNYGHNP
ncbi:uncharacterized protein LOC120089108 [Benincasa hispida]|uniref:uncharacterized protein LOC120089108 n=1 Tax=Benincasa hispida TaxID=102211 RepID=UPI001901E2C1|nr:uncharacterized protein LOC120089108 [Benincasa hispida]